MNDLRPKDAPAQFAKVDELTVPAILLGVTLSVVMGAANVYLGLRAGMTVSASIPAAVISMGLLRGVLRRTSVLESNLVQTAASAGESLAAGIIFTMPALLLCGVWEHFDFWTTTLIALSGGLLGVLLMIPMRQVFVVDNTELKFPEGVACAEVLRAGDSEGQSGSSGVRLVLGGIAVGGVFKMLQSFAGLFRGTAEAAVARGGRVFYVGAEISFALFAVGYIITLPIALQIFAGGAIGWLIGIPLIGTEGVDADTPVAIAKTIWSAKVRYLGVGAMLVGGISSIWSVRAGLAAAVRQLIEILVMAPDSQQANRTTRNLSGSVILALGLICVLLISAVYSTLLRGDVGLTVLTTVVMLVMSFFFAAVAQLHRGPRGQLEQSRLRNDHHRFVGYGRTRGVVWVWRDGGYRGDIGSGGRRLLRRVYFGRCLQRLEDGASCGASPRNQQIMQLIGVLTASFVMAPVMTVLHEGSLRSGTGGIGGQELSAPQAGLFAALVQGFFSEDGELPKEMVAWGVAIGIMLLFADWLLTLAGSKVRLHVMPVAVGIYLPFGLSVPMLLGGLVRAFVKQGDKPGMEEHVHRGILITSGLIAGESLVGVLLGLFAYLGVQSFAGSDWLAARTGLSPAGQDVLVQLISLSALLLVAIWVYRQANRPGS